ncbi:MAG TPA: thioredoxin domain-containing protein [Candidatus Dormibacteraeota bacterium]|nr:thioredoxin domain-containing protein [Candidatus Dormibacteraeota bacterium]
MAWFQKRLVLVVLLLAPSIALPAGAQAHRQSRPSGDPPPAIPAAQIAQGKALGVQAAPIKIEDFTDFECPACRALYMQTLHPLIEKYVSSGKVYLVHHDFPLPMHPYSHKAAYYADAAAAIGEFAPVENALFTHQPQWSSNGHIQPVLATVLSPADLRKVDELEKTPEIRGAVERDVELGTRRGVHETPTIYITYKGKRTPVIGVVSLPILERYLDALLRQ